MTKLDRLTAAICTTLFILGGVWVAKSAAPGVIQSEVAVCDPNSPSVCLTPNASGQTTTLIAPFNPVTGSTSTNAVYSNMPIDLLNYGNYASVNFMFTAANNSNVFQAEFSNDSSFPSNGTPATIHFIRGVQSHNDSTTNANPLAGEVWCTPLNGRFFRLRDTTNIGATDTAVVWLSNSPCGTLSVQQGAGLGGSSTWSANPIPSSDTSNYGITPSTTGMTATGLIAKASAGNSYGVYFTQRATTAEAYLVGINSNVQFPDGAITPSLVLECYPVGQGGVSPVNSLLIPKAYSAGITYFITIANTCYTKTTGNVSGFIGAMVK